MLRLIACWVFLIVTAIQNYEGNEQRDLEPVPEVMAIAFPLQS